MTTLYEKPSMILNPYRIAAAAAVVSGAYHDTQESGERPPGNHTFPNMAIGSPSATRRVVVAVGYRSGGMSSVSVGGVALSKDASAASSSGIFSAEIWSGIVPSGSTADVVISTGNQSWTTLSTFSVDSATVENTASANNASTLSVGLAATAGAYIVAIGVQSNPDGVNWSAPMVEAFDDGTNNQADGCSTASASNAAAGVNTVEATFVAGSATHCAILAAGYAA